MHIYVCCPIVLLRNPCGQYAAHISIIPNVKKKTSGGTFWEQIKPVFRLLIPLATMHVELINIERPLGKLKKTYSK